MSRTLQCESYCLDGLAMPFNQPLTWDLKVNRSALLIHDMQRYFVQALPDEISSSVINSIEKILRWARNNSIPVFYSAQPGDMTPEQRGLLNDLWGPGMRTMEEDRQIIAQLTPKTNETLLTKWRYSAFYHSPLADMLKELKRDSIIITGIYASVGISATAVEAFTRDIKPFVIADAIADFTQAGHQQTLNHLADNCARVVSINEVLSSD
ncbi:isochorismatase family protein [Pantoea sp. FN0307]|uniref:isochorismatase family protein n=1 Tax=Pantoea sp. FN0307 TaxID=3418560 RepID=UPI003CEF80C1